MSEKPGSILGGTLLIGGSCIGAGMLGLPILTGLAGFFPSFLMFIAAWAFMTLTGLLLVEVNGWFKTQVNLVSMFGHSLGRIGKALSWVLYLFLFYALLVAYISGSGGLSATFFQKFMSWNFPAWACSLFFVLLFGFVVYQGTRPVDLWNRVLMVGKILSYIGLVVLGMRFVKADLLLHTEPSYALFSLPILIISFGFHNMIPSLTAYMKGDLKRVRLTILGGSLFALVVYLIWELIVLGIVPVDGPSGIAQSYKMDKEASQVVTSILGISWVSTFAQTLGFFAILTSFLAQALGLVHFLADGMNVSHEKKENGWLCALALGPPLLVALIYPNLFYKALNFAGGICAVLLFGILPVCMVWIGRYRKQTLGSYQVPGGKPLLIGIFLFSLLIMFVQISGMAGASYISKP
ncbi:MAG: tyrosine transporter [Chlamydiales bacterium]|nr:tyrosine transporter [Chlamydiales bacterium]